MQKDFFVMLNYPNGGICPMVDNNGNLLTYDAQEEAEVAAKNSSLGKNCGFEVFERGCGA